jgi:hypothetical protein
VIKFNNSILVHKKIVDIKKDNTYIYKYGD